METLKRPEQKQSTSVATIILGILALGLVGAVLTGTTLPFVNDDRGALIALAAIGFAMCATGPLSQIAAKGAWLSWSGIVGVALGVVALAVVVGALSGAQMPLVANEREAFLALTAIAAVKLGLGVLYRLTR